MFATYAYNGGAALKNIAADIIAILTGTTNKALLSGDCNQVGTSVTATVAAGWSTTTGGIVAPEYKALPQIAAYATAPVSNGTYMLLPAWGSNKMLKSTDEGTTWVSYDLPVSLGALAVPTNGVYEPLTWNGTLWVLTDPSQSVNYVLTSTDGQTWTSRSTTTNGQWHKPVWSGAIWVITSLVSTQAIITSTDGTTWTYRATALPSTTPWGSPVYAGSIWMVTPNNLNSSSQNSTAFATSTDGITWTARTFPVATYAWTPKYLNNNLWVIAGNPNALGYILTSADGTTFTQKILASAIWDVQYADGVYVASTIFVGSTGYVYTSNDGMSWAQTLTGSYFCPAVYSAALGLWVVFPGYNSTTFYTSTDAISWTARALPTNNFTNNTYAVCLLVNGIFFVFSQYTANNFYWMSYDGLSWVRKNAWPFSQLFTQSVVKRDAIAVVNNVAYFLNAALSATIGRLTYNSAGTVQCLRALNADTTTYKKVLLDVSNSVVTLMTAEDIGVNTVTNKTWLSDLTEYSQPLDLTNGGLLFIQATEAYIYLMSYLPQTSTWGSATGNGCTAVSEYSRDDGWNIGTGGNPYPTHCWINSGLFLTAIYAPRLKSAANVDVTGSAAILTPFIGNPFPKQTLNVNSLTVPPSISVRISNFSTLTYGVLGGILSGGVRQTVASYGNSGDEMMLGSTNYFMYGGSTARLLVPMQ